MNDQKFYVTTPIYYVNDRPHVGHAYTTIIADTLARSARLVKKDVVFLAGTDEHSQKTVDAAQKSGEDPLRYADRLAGVWKSAWEALGITNTDFIRTTESRHIETVGEVWRRIFEKGDMYKGNYRGLYCKGHEAFMKETELVDGLCPDHKTKPEHIEEQNYFFKLSKYEKDLLRFYESVPDFVFPAGRFNEVKNFVRSGLEDISVSREGKRWGIPVPGDTGHVIYVWFDALINYISAVGIEKWEKHPADVHVMGKDIMRFHAVIWPAMLMSAGLPLPRRIIANGFFTADGTKISKSLGNAIDPLELAGKYGSDALRYFLLREIPFGEDGDFSREKFKERYNGDLANGLGNFAARVLALGLKEKQFPDTCRFSDQLSRRVEVARTVVKKKMEQYAFSEALIEIWNLIGVGDRYVNDKKPWSVSDPKEKQQIVFDLVVLLDNVAGFLPSFLPETAEKITRAIGWAAPARRSEPRPLGREEGSLVVKKIDILFPKLE